MRLGNAFERGLASATRTCGERWKAATRADRRAAHPRKRPNPALQATREKHGRLSATAQLGAMRGINAGKHGYLLEL